MIPYDDLVIALATWRARQGLPVAQPGALTPPPVTAPVRMTPLPGPSGPLGAPASLGPAARTAPPSAPPSRAAPPPRAAAQVVDDHLEVDPSLIEDGHYEAEGDDFAVAFDNLQGPGSDAAQPEQTVLEDMPGRAPKGRGRPDW